MDKNKIYDYHQGTIEFTKDLIKLLRDKELIDEMYCTNETLENTLNDLTKIERFFMEQDEPDQWREVENKETVRDVLKDIEQYNRNREHKDWKTKGGEKLDKESQDALNDISGTFVNEDGNTLDEAIELKHKEDQELEEFKQEWFYITDINSFQCSDNEIYLGVERYDENKKTGKYEKKEFTLVFESYSFLNSGIADTKYIKSRFIKYIRSIC